MHVVSATSSVERKPVACMYGNKSDQYFSGVNLAVIRLMPESSSARVLDVGCGDGSLGRTLKESGKAHFVAGVELHGAAASKATGVLDAVHVADIERWETPPEYVSSFDFVIFADVLEHLVDPHAALKRCAALLSDDGVVIASIPNVRWAPVVWELAIRGNWRYESFGVLDETHLRFFTKRTMREMFETCGFEIEACLPQFYCSWPRPFRIPLRVVAMLLGTFEELTSIQYVVKAQLARTVDDG